MFLNFVNLNTLFIEKGSHTVHKTQSCVHSLNNVVLRDLQIMTPDVQDCDNDVKQTAFVCSVIVYNL